MDYIDIFIKNNYINLKQIAESGQCFRWKKMCPGRYFVISDGRAACFFQEKTGIRILCREKDEEYFRRYLDLDIDYGKVIEQIDEKDDFLIGAAQMGRGIRILRQNLWEMIISFIISQRNNIPRIMKSIDALCEKLGEQIVFDYEGEHLVGYTFPSPEVIVGADLSEFKFGYREKYIRQTAENILEGKFDLEEVKDAVDEGKTPEQVKEMLKQLKGVGEKVASCIQLFGLHQLELFPIDTWIAKVEKMYYNGHFPVEKYKDTAGIMQQYLFFRVREDADKRAVLEMKSEVGEKAASNLEKNLKSGVASNLKKNSNTGEENQIQKSGRKMATYYEKIATEHMEKFYVERRDVYHKPFSKVEKLEDILEEDIIYFSICYEEEVLRPFYEYLKKDEKLNLNFYKDVYGNGLWYLEISHKNASKYHGVQKLRAMLQPDAITGMGDNLNDIPLFEACDRCCAVGNAHKEVKERAEYVLDTNLNAGVVKFLEEEMMS